MVFERFRPSLAALVVALIAAVVSATPVASAQTDVVINELVAANDTTLVDGFGETPDWIELSNPSGSAVSLDGWVISDAGTSWPFPAGLSIPAGGYLVVLASGRSTVTGSGEVHSSFSLSRGGETVTLVNADGAVVDRLTYPELVDDMAFGVGSNGEAGILVSATPGQANTALRPASVLFASSPGPFTGSKSVTLVAATKSGEAIFYRTDGRAPTLSSSRYSGAISFSKTTTITAAVLNTTTGQSGPIGHGTYTAVASTMSNYSSSLPLLIVDPASELVRSGGWSASSPSIRSTVTLVDRRSSGRSYLLDPATEDGWATAKVRGSTSALMARPGMSFEWQTDSTATQNQHRPMLGLAADDDWVLVAAGDIGDQSMINDPFSYELGDLLGVSTMDYRFVEVLVDNNLNGVIDLNDRRGLYMLIEKIENGSHRVPVSDAGIRLSLDKPDDCCHVIDDTPDSYDRTGLHIIMLEDPNKRHATSADVTWAKNWYDDAETSFTRSWNDPNGPQRYVDIDSFVNYWLIQAFSHNFDGLRASNYFYMERGEPLVNGPLWDFDRAYPIGTTSGWHNHFTIWWYEHLWAYPEFQAMVKARWFELREPGQPLHNTGLVELARRLDDEVREVAQRSGTTYNPSGFQAWLPARANWIDSQWRAGTPPTVHREPDVVTDEDVAVTLQIDVTHTRTVAYDDHGTLPPGLMPDTATGEITGSVPIGNAGAYRPVITVTDTTGASSSTEFNLIVNSQGSETAPLLLNEYNAVGASESLDSGGSDSHFGQVIGNGGNWIELVVLQDHLDVRGWKLELWDKRVGDLPAKASTLTFGSSPRLADLRAGTILTISEAEVDDVAFAPAAGDWHMNFQANAADAGAYVSTGGTGFDTNHEGMRIRFIDADGEVVGPTQGEVEASVADLGDRQVMVAAIDPTGAGQGMAIDVKTAFAAITDSTFGEANQVGLTTQNLDGIRPDDIVPDGDVDGDGSADTADVADILRTRIGEEVPGFASHRGDLDGDGIAALGDAMWIAQCLASGSSVMGTCSGLAG